MPEPVAVHRAVPGAAARPGRRPEPVEVVVAGAGSTHRFLLHDVGLACCAVEVGAAVLGGALGPAGPQRPGERVTHVLVVSGTVTARLAPAVVARFAALPRPRRVVSFGACAISGGPYWDSYSVTPGVDRLLPVDVYLPGCPPAPDALAAALLELAGVLDGGRAAAAR